MHAGLDRYRLWGTLFVETMMHGRLINRVFPRVYDKEELAEISQPVLFVFGDSEVIYGDLKEAIQSGKNLIPQASVSVVPNAHHMPAVAQPEAVNQEFLRFFADRGR